MQHLDTTDHPRAGPRRCLAWAARGVLIAAWTGLVVAVALAATRPGTDQIRTLTDEPTISRLRAHDRSTAAGADRDHAHDRSEIPGTIDDLCVPGQPWCREPPPLSDLAPPAQRPLDERETESFALAPQVDRLPVEENQLQQEIGVRVFTEPTTTTTSPPAERPEAAVGAEGAEAPPAAQAPEPGAGGVAETPSSAPGGPLVRTGLGPLLVGLALAGLALIGAGWILRRLTRKYDTVSG